MLQVPIERNRRRDRRGLQASSPPPGRSQQPAPGPRPVERRDDRGDDVEEAVGARRARCAVVQAGGQLEGDGRARRSGRSRRPARPPVRDVRTAAAELEQRVRRARGTGSRHGSSTERVHRQVGQERTGPRSSAPHGLTSVPIRLRSRGHRRAPPRCRPERARRHRGRRPRRSSPQPRDVQMNGPTYAPRGSTRRARWAVRRRPSGRSPAGRSRRRRRSASKSRGGHPAPPGEVRRRRRRRRVPASPSSSGRNVSTMTASSSKYSAPRLASIAAGCGPCA